jgi:hypothetical protein
MPAEFSTYLVFTYVIVVVFFFDTHACIFVYKSNDNQEICSKIFPQHTSILFAYKLNYWTIAAKTIFQNFLIDTAKHTLQRFSQYHCLHPSISHFNILTMFYLSTTINPMRNPKWAGNKRHHGVFHVCFVHVRTGRYSIDLDAYDKLKSQMYDKQNFFKFLYC